MENLLIKIKVFQKQKGKIRLNPYNPLSYLVLFFVIILGNLCYGFAGIKNLFKISPFKYQ